MNKFTLLRQLKSNHEELKQKLNKQLYNNTPVKIVYILGLLLAVLLVILNVQKGSKSVQTTTRRSSSFIDALKLQLATWLIDLAKKELTAWIKKQKSKKK